MILHKHFLQQSAVPGTHAGASSARDHEAYLLRQLDGLALLPDREEFPA